MTENKTFFYDLIIFQIHTDIKIAILVLVYITFLIHLSINNTGCFHVLTLMNNTAKNTGLKCPFDIAIAFLELLDHMTALLLTFLSC